MTAKIKMRPDGREFTAGPNDTILDAALSAGIALTYSCNNGSCGECRARLVSGQLGETRHHDYRFSASDQAVGYFLTCCSLASEDIEIEAHEAGGVEDIPLQSINAQISKLEVLSEDVMAVHLRTPRSKSLRFLAGQHVTLEIDGLMPRNKSIASCPCNATNLQFHIKRTEGDPFSEYCFSALKTGLNVKVSGPYGNFVFDDGSVKPVIFLAYDTGFAPAKSLIEHALAIEYEQPVHLYWILPHGTNPYMENYCRAWMDACDNFSFTVLQGVADEDAASCVDKSLLVGVQRLVADFPELGGHDVYLSSPEISAPSSRAILLEHGLPEKQLYIDVFQRF
ncbi:MAG: 2Fe-2S iron-sulfur cluster-binding protein [Sulfuricellaceae bacterium]|nr:2Fe-2S iron-sulfur cluster-binding protein [Sulfuricellaceae bacterium]